jgi:tetratricopeptide (TPR) repeat protein
LADTLLIDEHRIAVNASLQAIARAVAGGKLDTAKQLCDAALRTNPADHRAIFWRGVVALERREFAAAVEHFRQAIHIEPSVAEYHAGLGRCYIALQQTAPARQAADAAMACTPQDARSFDSIGVIYSFAGEHERACQAFERAVCLDPDKDSYWYNRGASLKFAGRFDEAEASYERAIALNPAHEKAVAALSHMRRQTPERNHIDALKLRLRNYPGTLPDEMRLSFALAKEYDDVGQYGKAFSTLSDVCKRWRQSVRYSIDDDRRVFDALLTAFTPQAIASAQRGHDSQEPIFVVGLPRTGTTLTERILSAHPDVYSAGELNKMAMLLQLAAKAKSNRDLQPTILRYLLAADLGKLGAKYIESTRPATGHTPRFVDKMPLNFLFIGFILLALPQAKVVVVRRNPLDSCLSNFRQLFALRSPYYAYSYDILDCGRYYLLFDQLMRHWDELFPGRIHTVRYEDIVENQQATTRMLLDYCELPWNDACLRFEQNASPVATASSAQVREPVYRTALARWKNYRKELEPLAELLRKGGVSVD